MHFEQASLPEAHMSTGKITPWWRPAVSAEIVVVVAALVDRC